MDWKELIDALGSALAQVEERAAAAAPRPNDQNEEEQQPHQLEDEDEEREDPPLPLPLPPRPRPLIDKDDAAVQTMNHKLIEIHSRLKSFDEEAAEIPPAYAVTQVSQNCHFAFENFLTYFLSP